MSNPTEKIFAQGLIVKRRETAPSFVTCSLSVKADEFKAFIDEHQNNGWVNLNVKQSQSGKYYAELDTWKPQSTETAQVPQQAAQGAENTHDLPF